MKKIIHRWGFFSVALGGEVTEEDPDDPEVAPQVVYVPAFVAEELLHLAEENERLQSELAKALQCAPVIVRVDPDARHLAPGHGARAAYEKSAEICDRMAAHYKPAAGLIYGALSPVVAALGFAASNIRAQATRHDASLQDKPPATDS